MSADLTLDAGVAVEVAAELALLPGTGPPVAGTTTWAAPVAHPGRPSAPKGHRPKACSVGDSGRAEHVRIGSWRIAVRSIPHPERQNPAGRGSSADFTFRRE